MSEPEKANPIQGIRHKLTPAEQRVVVETEAYQGRPLTDQEITLALLQERGLMGELPE